LLYFSDPSSLEHDPRDVMPGTSGVAAADRRGRTPARGRRLLSWERRPAPAATREELELAHTARHVAAIRELSESGGGAIDVETYDGPASYRAAAHAAGGASAMARALLAGEGAGRLQPRCGPARPPRRTGAGDGFCLFDSIAVAAALAVAELGASRV